tara:strand:- start:1107 stop:2954 length:1848 start_codon:yes stop_codon:yes gene_type:complete
VVVDFINKIYLAKKKKNLQFLPPNRTYYAFQEYLVVKILVRICIWKVSVMKNLVFLIFIPFILGCSVSFEWDKNNFKKKVRFDSSEVIYGIDDRVEIDDWDGKGNVKELSTSVLSLYKENGEEAKLNRLPSPLCEGEPFRDQPRKALCTGILIAPDMVLTAGHCLKKNNQCKNLVWKFDYPGPEASLNRPSEEEKKAYRCSHVIRPKNYYQNRRLDFAFVKLEEPVLERNPFSLEEAIQDIEIRDGEGVFAIGNPSGFPLKVMKGEVTFKNEDGLFFKTNIDSYRGNSGAPIFTKKESRLIGLLVSGERDFEFDSLKGCYYSKRCLEGEESNCSGEKAISISNIYESYKWIKDKKNNHGKKLFSHFKSFEKACSSDELDAKSKYFLSLLEEKARSQNCSTIKKRLERARYLDLSSSFIEDSYALSFFSNLEFLNLENNNIEDLEFLNSFSNLQLLYLKGNNKLNKIDIDNLNGLKKLSFSNRLPFVGSFKDMTSLSSLIVENIDPRILSSISDLEELKELSIKDSNLSSSSFLNGLSNLEKLSLTKSKLKDILFVSRIPKIRFLDISENLIEDLSPLYSLENLYSFKAEGNPIKDCPLNSVSFALKSFCEKRAGL